MFVQDSNPSAGGTSSPLGSTEGIGRGEGMGVVEIAPADCPCIY